MTEAGRKRLLQIVAVGANGDIGGVFNEFETLHVFVVTIRACSG